MIVLDTSAVYAALVDTETHHREAREALERETGPLLLSPFVLCELDYLVRTSIGTEVQLRLLGEILVGAYTLVPFGSAEVGVAAGIVERYADLRISLADASIVVLADRHGTDRVLTLDERHFRALRTLGGDPFVLLPADG